MQLSEQAVKKIDREIAKYPADQKQSAVMAALAIAQDEKGWLAPEVMQDVATFYAMYNLKPLGKHKITICTNLPCALSGGEAAANYLKEKLGVDFQGTTSDGAFTLQEGECMGACGDSPVLLVNNKRMCSHMNNEKIDALVEELKK